MSNSFRRTAASVAIAASCWSMPAADMTLLGTHPTAALAGATELGTLKPYDGRIYIGHGEWNNYHQIVVACYNPAAHAIETEYLVPTDAIGIFREIGGKLYIPSTDPVHFDEFADYSVLDQGVWRSFAPAGLLHAFEMSTLTGSDLWMVGSKTDNDISRENATVLRSFNGGRTWMDVTGPWSGGPGRQYWSLAYQGKLYVRDSFYTNNTAIQITPPLFEQMFNPTEYGSGSEQVMLAQARTIAYPGTAAHNLYSFNGSGWLLQRPNVRDFAVRNSEVYTLEKTNLLAEAELWVGTSITTSNAAWRRLPINNLTNGASITVLDDIVYVGDTRGQFWAARIDGTPLQLGPAAMINKMPDGFGRALASHGPNLAVGAPEHSGTNLLSGQVTLWQQNGGQWTRTQTLDPPQPIFSGLFGKDVAMSETALAVLEGGRRGEIAKVHLYENRSPGWGLTQSLAHPFAHAIAMSGDRLGIATSTRVYIYRCGPGTNGFGATLETSFPHNATVLYEPTGRIAMHADILAYGAVGDFSRQGGPGHVAIYERYLDSIWLPVTNLLQNSPPLAPGLVRHADAFGFALGLSDGWLVVGAPRDDTAASQAGAVYLYQRSINADGTPFYSLRQKIPCPLHQAEARFGESLSIAGDYLVVGASGADDGPTRQRGNTFVYKRDGQEWRVLGQITRPEGSIVGFGSEVLATTNLTFVGSRNAATNDAISQRIAVSGFPDGSNLVDLAVSHSITPTAATNGSALDYTFSVTNRGPVAATDVHLAFAVPQNLVIENITSSAFACTNTGFDVVCWLDRLDPDSGASIYVVGRAVLTNTCDAIRVAASVWSAEVDSDPSNNQTIAVVNPPGIRLVEPADGASFPFASVIQVNAVANSPTEFQGVSFYANATRLAGFTSPPYTYTWNLTNQGAFYLTVRTTNSCGLVATSAVANVVVRANVPPTARILHPISGTRIAEGSTFPIIVAATDEDTPPPVRALISANGVRLADLRQPPPYTHWWSNAPAGDYVLSARVSSSGGLVDAFARVFIGPEEIGSTNWIVYIDHSPGAQTAAGVNGWNIPAPSATSGGGLRTVFDAVLTKASILISRSPGQARTNAATDPNPSTPAHDIFSGLVDFTAGPIPNVALPGKEWVRHTFTGLDPNLRYNFRGTAVGGNADYSNRWTLVGLVGARSFLSSHTAGCLTEGVGTIQSNQVAFNSGDNRAGEVVGWDSIRPAPDGSITIECRQYSGVVPGGTSSGINGFALTAMRLEELVLPVDPPPVVETNPIPTAVSTGGSVQFIAVVTTQGPVTYQWLRNGIILPDQTNSVLNLTGISTNDAGSYILIATGDTGSAASNPAGLTVVKIAVDQAEPQPRARLDIHGPPLQTYNIQGKDILSETIPWTDLSTITLQTNANTFIDTTSQSIPTRFYRIIPVP
jgi:uncharacterized repeat protein (TIGR01451 family)